MNLLDKLLDNELFKQINISCKFPLMKKSNIEILKELILLFPEFDKKDIIFIKQNINNKEFLLHSTTCKCGNFKHTYLNYCSRKCNYFKQAVVKKMEETCLKTKGVRNASLLDEVKNKISIKNKSKSEYAKIIRIQTNLKRFGVDNYTKTDECKNKMKQTNLNKYGTEYYSQTKEYNDKCKQTNKERFGKDYYSQTQEWKDRIVDTSLEKFGANNVRKSDYFKQKVKEINLQKYGKEYYTQTNEYRKRCREVWNNKSEEELKDIKERSKQTRIKNGNQYPDNIIAKFIEQWNLDRKPTPNDFTYFVRKYTGNDCSKTMSYGIINKFNSKELFQYNEPLLEIIVEDFLNENNIKFEKRNRTLIKPLELDFYLPDYKVAIEVNDIWSHNSTVGPIGSKPKPLNYHFNKTIKCQEKGIRLIHIYEPYIFNTNSWNIIKNIILHSCNRSKKIYARNTEVVIKPASDMKDFFNKNNIQGYRPAKTAFILVDKKTKEPLMCYTVGYAWFGKGKYDAEITRGACKLGYTIVGGASKLWKHIIEYYKDKDLNGNKGSIDSIVYYVDLNYYNGSSINFLKNTKFIKNQLSFWNYWVDEKILKNRDPNKHKKIKQLEQQGKILVVGNSGTQVNLWTRNK